MDIVILLLLILVNGLFALSETAFIAARRDVLAERAAKGNRHAGAILHLMDEPERFLSSIQVGITLIGIISGAYSGVALARHLALVLSHVPWLEPYAYGISLVGIIALVTYLSIIFGELFPKVIALRNPERLLLAVFPFIHAFAGAVRPVVTLLSGSTRLLVRVSRLGAATVDKDRDPVASMLGAARLAVASHILDEQQEKIVRNTVSITALPIRSMMVALDDVILLDTGMSLNDALIVAHIHHHTRYPLTEGADRTRIAGYVNFKDIINAVRMSSGAPTLRSICRPVLYLQEDDRALAALRRMAVARHHMALVRGDGGRVTGLITMETILEAIVGNMGDEYDLPPSFAYAISPGRHLCGGGIRMDQLARDISPGIPASAATLNEWAQAHLGRAPRIEERIPCGPVTVIARKISRKRLYEAIIEAASPPARPPSS